MKVFTPPNNEEGWWWIECVTPGKSTIELECWLYRSDPDYPAMWHIPGVGLGELPPDLDDSNRWRVVAKAEPPVT